MKLQLVAVGTKMPDWVQTGFSEYLRRFPKDMPFELVEIPAGKRGKNADIKRILDEEAGKAAEPKEPPAMTNLQRIKLVTSVIETKVAPTLRRDGGDIELIDVDGVDVYVKLRGACAGCPGAKATLHNIVQETLRAEVDRKITIIEVK